MSKKSRRKLSPNAFLRPRLDALVGSEAFPKKKDRAIKEDLDAVGRGIKPGFFLQTMLHAYLAAPAAARARLDVVVPEWLRERNHVTTLSSMIASHILSGELRQQALVWLGETGADVQASTPSSQDLFYQAHYHSDESQAVVTLVGYTDAKKRRAQGWAFLIDYNPPWEGAVKDILLTPRRQPQDVVREFLNTWSQGGTVLKAIRAGQAKTKILTALDCNRSAGIRLPRDLIINREPFVHYVLSLPDEDDTPTFTLDDFDLLAKQGKRPEEIMHFEQTVGRRVRLEDGRELLIVGSLDDLDDEW